MCKSHRGKDHLLTQQSHLKLNHVFYTNTGRINSIAERSSSTIEVGHNQCELIHYNGKIVLS